MNENNNIIVEYSKFNYEQLVSRYYQYRSGADIIFAGSLIFIGITLQIVPTEYYGKFNYLSTLALSFAIILLCVSFVYMIKIYVGFSAYHLRSPLQYSKLKIDTDILANIIIEDFSKVIESVSGALKKLGKFLTILCISLLGSVLMTIVLVIILFVSS